MNASINAAFKMWVGVSPNLANALIYFRRSLQPWKRISLGELILQIKLVRTLYGGSSFGSNVGHCTFIKGGLVVHCTVSYISSVGSNWI